MQCRRPVLVAVVLGLALPAVPATAAKAKPKPKPLPCKQISDDAGDGRVNPVGLTSDTLDVLSADLSSGPKEVTAILRMKSTAVENDHNLAGGASWGFNVTVGGVSYAFYARWPTVVSVAPRKLEGGLTVGSSEASPPATFRREGNNYVWTVPRAAFPALKKPKTYFTITSANSGANSFSADSAFAKPNTRYLDRTLTCLPSK